MQKKQKEQNELSDFVGDLGEYGYVKGILNAISQYTKSIDEMGKLIVICKDKSLLKTLRESLETSRKFRSFLVGMLEKDLKR